MKNRIKQVSVIVMTVLLFAGLALFQPGSSGAADQTPINNIICSGGAIGGTSNLSASAMGALIYKYCKIPTTITLNATYGQIGVLQKKEADIATAVGTQALEAYNGTWKGKPYPDVRTLLQSNSQIFHWVVLKGSPIQNFKDLKDKRISVGRRGSMSELNAKRVCEILGVEYGKFFTPLNLGQEDAPSSLITGKIDAFFVMSDYPQPQVMELTESHACRILGLDNDQMAKMLAKYPGLLKTTIPAGTYKGMDREAQSIMEWMFYTCDKRLPDDVAYCSTKSFFENIDFVGSLYAALKDYKLKDIELFISAPYHKGALRYFKEKKLKVQDAMIPPEAK